MRGFPFLSKAAFVGIVVGGIGGLVLALVAEEMDRQTSTDAFCTSCHAMQTYIADTETYKTSAHQTTTSGVRPGCADCHIPKGLIPATYTHAVNGISDIWGEISLDYDDPAVWHAEKARLAYATRDWFRANDSVTCRECHEQDAIKPVRKRGQRQHKEARETGMTCIDCHYNLVHEEIEPRESFLEQAEMGQ
jgi:nitrate/TMAO reductase-like tetraheme cytochrome c subunit